MVYAQYNRYAIPNDVSNPSEHITPKEMYRCALAFTTKKKRNIFLGNRYWDYAAREITRVEAMYFIEYIDDDPNNEDKGLPIDKIKYKKMVVLKIKKNKSTRKIGMVVTVK